MPQRTAATRITHAICRFSTKNCDVLWVVWMIVSSDLCAMGRSLLHDLDGLALTNHRCARRDDLLAGLDALHRDLVAVRLTPLDVPVVGDGLSAFLRDDDDRIAP